MVKQMPEGTNNVPIGDVEAAVRALVKPGSLNPTADELDQ